MNGTLLRLAVIVSVATLIVPGLARAADKKPNIVIIWGDDIGQSNSYAHHAGKCGAVGSLAESVPRRHDRP